MADVKNVLKKSFVLMIMFIVGLTMTFGVTTEDVSAATKKPSKVTITGVKSYDYNAVKITWKATKNAKKYQVYRATSKNGKYKKIKTTTGKTYINKKLTTGKKYYYKVRAVNGSKKGSFSAKKYAVPKLKQVSGAKVAVKSTGATISWNKVSGAKGYQIYRAASKNGTYKKIKTTTATSYNNTGLSKGKTYYYKVRAYRVVGKSTKYGSCSTVISAKVKSAETTNTNSITSIRNEMLNQINANRKAAGAASLKLYEPVNVTAQEKAKDLYSNDFSHYSPNLGYFYDQYEAAGIDYWAGGENIAYNSSDVTFTMSQWMNSKGHKANILSKDYTHVGIGYYKGFWVQQFIKLPETESDSLGSNTSTAPAQPSVKCDECGAKNRVSEYAMYSKDAEGNKYGCFYCYECGNFIEKCPKCDTGIFTAVGVNKIGSLAEKCNKCGHMQDETCIDKCTSCNAAVLDDSITKSYTVTFDSTRTYDGDSYDWEEGCYFQQFVVDMRVCEKCNKVIFVKDINHDTYLEAMTKLKAVIGENSDPFDGYIRWEKVVGSELVESGENYSKWKQIYEFIDTPVISELDELAGKNQI